jgi:hypothetical protein
MYVVGRASAAFAITKNVDDAIPDDIAARTPAEGASVPD